MIRNSTMSKNEFRNQRTPLPQGKIQDEFLGCRRREPPTTVPDNTSGQTGISGHSNDMVRPNLTPSDVSG